MNKIRKTLFIGAPAAAVLLAALMLLPVVPFSFALQPSTYSPPSLSCLFPPMIYQKFSTQPHLHINSLKLDSNVTLSLTELNNRSYFYQPFPQNSTTFPPGHWVKHGTDNLTLYVGISGVHVHGLNGSATKANFQYWFNGTLDSYLYASGISVTTTKPNATSRLMSISIAHLSFLNGKQLKWPINGEPWLVGVAISVDNLRYSVLYNCSTGGTSYLTSGTTTGLMALSAGMSSIGRTRSHFLSFSNLLLTHSSHS